MGLYQSLCESADACRVRRIHHHRGHAGIGGRHLVEHGLAPAGNDDPVAGLVKGLRQSTTDAGTAAGDENGIARDFHGNILCLLAERKLAMILSNRK